ncbi:glycosyltransferase involved in cell wall biosynthesis [Desulfomicrobium macestii]|uniref:Glycosyltransferase involved in cell wall biosynthesis n=1 Tax=Desulfomicrobium macestii TaxID=90731 RepID=A0ABR9H6M6_9BACT|nr:glycosyltransferase [Desulfomicrobium macestii]MBE1426364.1 glycosyltransferase involved in cell wall biosynthesis [Desulfomicrobium macestii]
MKIAIIHYWFIAQRGGEKVVEELCNLYPDADIFSHVVDRETLPPCVATRKIFTSFIDNLPFSNRWYKHYLPLMPLALEQFDLREYDLVISSESGPAKGVLTSPDALHICYCHTPMRYVWDMYHDYMSNSGRIKRFFMAPLLHYLRIWDRLSVDRVDHFVANSVNVARRIAKHYRRDADVVYPPVAVDDFSVSEQQDDFYLMVGQLVGYKRADLAVKAFTRSGKRLVIIGEGEQGRLLREIAGNNVEFLGRQPFEVLRNHYSRCQALIFPGEEDFGIVPLEAMASGRPVIAFGKGGALETVVDGKTGIFFHEQTEDALMEAVERFEGMNSHFHPAEIRAHACGFGPERFRAEMAKIIEIQLQAHTRAMGRWDVQA